MTVKAEQVLSAMGQKSNVNPAFNEAARKWRKAIADIVANLPSKKKRGTVAVRLERAKTNVNMRHRRNKVAPIPSRAMSPDEAEMNELWAEMESRGLRVDGDDDGEPLNEIDRLKQLDVIKQMPVNLRVKRKLRDRLYSNMADVEKSACGAWRYRTKLAWVRHKQARNRKLQDFANSLFIWESQIKKIEGYFGGGVGTYFRYSRLLFILNLTIFFIMFCFICVPQIIFELDHAPLDYSTVNYTYLLSTGSDDVLACSAKVHEESDSYSREPLSLINNFLDGAGWMEYTYMFYGFYHEDTMELYDTPYNLPLAYIFSAFVCLICSLIAITVSTVSGYKSRLMSASAAVKQFTNHVFGSWDFSMTDNNAAILTQKSIWRAMITELAEDRRRREKKSRTTSEKCKLYTVRFFVNFLVLLCLGGSGYLIYYTSTTSAELMRDADYVTRSAFEQFAIAYMTSVTMTVLNAILPTFFKKIVKFEDYAPGFENNMTLFRTVFLKLSSLAILLSTIYSLITCHPQDTCRIGQGDCTAVGCWETYVGQELYKLVIMDFFVPFATTFTVETIRRLLVDHVKALSKIGRQEFDVAKNNLNLVYGQTLLWLSMFFSPLIPAIVVMKMFIIFYTKEFTVLFNYRPSSVPYRASESQSFFMMVLLTAFVLATLPLFFCIWQVPPSRGCGPFRDLDYMYEEISDSIEKLPGWADDIIDFLGSALFLIPLCICLGLMLFYVSRKSAGYQDMNRVLQDQLHREGEDKRYLMTKLAELGGTPQVIRSQDDRKPAGSGEEYVTDDETREAASALISDETMYSETDETRPPRAVITDDV